MDQQGGFLVGRPCEGVVISQSSDCGTLTPRGFGLSRTERIDFHWVVNELWFFLNELIFPKTSQMVEFLSCLLLALKEIKVVN